LREILNTLLFILFDCILELDEYLLLSEGEQAMRSAVVRGHVRRFTSLKRNTFVRARGERVEENPSGIYA